MTAQEMHIEVKQATQNISANVRRKLQDEEIDWLLNKNQERFIQSRVKPKKDGSGGFQIDQLDTDSIRTLLVTNKELGLYKVSNGVVSAYLPADYSYLISDDAKVLALCNVLAPDVINYTENITTLTIPTSSKTTPKYYAALSITVGSTVIPLSEINAFYSSSFAGTASKSEKFVIRDLLLWYLRYVKGIDTYWEKYKDVFKSNSFIFPGVTSASITVDTVTTSGTTVSKTYTRYENSNGTFTPNRLSPSDKMSTLLVTPFFGPTQHSPLSELSGNSLNVYENTSYLVTGVQIDYVKKPRRISLPLLQDCELPEEFHQSVCDLTAEYIKAMLGDPNWEVKLKDNVTRSIV